jgi:hypothetical protein
MKDQPNERLRAAMLEVVNQQLETGEPSETAATHQRLMDSGLSDQESRRLIAIVVGDETFRVMKEDTPYRHERFVELLDKLPTLPWE